MRLSRFSDYSIRVLLFLATHRDRISSIGEVAEAYEISQNHLMKVVSELSARGYVTALRGRNGGIRLALQPEEINIGRLIRQTEGKIDLVECANCKLLGFCRLPGPLDLALSAFFDVLERYTLADVVADGGRSFLNRDE